MQSQSSPETNSVANTHTNQSKIFTDKELQVTRVLFKLRWRAMTQLLLALPVIGLFLCLFTSLIYHADHINNTICDVYNFLPSISAVTGVSPQRYLWRACVALHLSPRLLVAYVAKEFYSSLASRVSDSRQAGFLGLVTLSFFLNITELATLCGVTYISNKENYPVHEKLFMLFMVASLMYMVCVVRLLQTIQDCLPESLLTSLAHKKWLLGTKLAATLGLLFFFWRHRVHCQPKAFSWFSLCEYVIATCNMLFHVSVALDFSEEYLIVGRIDEPSSNNTTKQPVIMDSKDHDFEISTVVNNPSPPSTATSPLPEDLSPVSSSYCYSRFSGSSNSSSESPCLTESSSDISISSSGSSANSPTGGDTSSSQGGGIGVSDSVGSVRQVLSTIEESSAENGLQKRIETPETAVKERTIGNRIEETSTSVVTTDIGSNDMKTKDILSFPITNPPQNFSCLDKSHIE